MFQKHEQSIIQILTANTKIINEQIDELSKKINDMQESLEFTEVEMKEKISRVEMKQTSELSTLKNKIRDLEDRSRRNNLRIDGVAESLNETWETTEKKVMDVFENKLGLRNIIIERAHRAAASQKQKQNNQPRTIIMKLLNYKEKELVMKNAKKLKRSGIFINEDFSKETTAIRKTLWNEVLELRQKGKYAILQYDKIISRDFKK